MWKNWRLAALRASSYIRSLNPRLPRAVWTIEVGGFVNAFGNGVVYPFLFIYLHNVRGFGLGTVGLVLGTNGVVSLVVGPASGGEFPLGLGGKRDTSPLEITLHVIP